MLIAMVVIVAGCGGGSSDADGQTYSVEANTTIFPGDLTKAKFIPRVNKICRQAWVTVLGNWDEYSSTQDSRLSEKARFADAVQLSLMAGIEFHIFDNIYQTGEPQGGGHDVERMIGTLQSAIERGQKKLAPIGSVAQITELFGDYNQLASRYGLSDCLVDQQHLRGIET